MRSGCSTLSDLIDVTSACWTRLGHHKAKVVYSVPDRGALQPPVRCSRTEVSTVLFVCLHNAGRSQMSEALFERAAKGRHTAASAGTIPADQLHPEVIEVMREVGIDLQGREPKALTHELAEHADIIVTMGCGDNCPVLPGKRYLDWDLPDPKGRPLDEVRAIRDDIASRVDDLIAALERTHCEAG